MTDARPNDGRSIDQRLTADRTEKKYRVPLPRAREIARALDEHLRPHRFTGPGANRLPGARHFVTTVYFDTAHRELYTDARSNRGSLKIRAKEYYDQHLALIEVARDRSAVMRSSPVLWVELKQTEGEHSGKRRVGIPKCELARFFAHGAISEQTLEIQRQAYGDDGGVVIDALLDVCQRFSTALSPSALVNYRRSAWQGEGQAVRVTIDRELAFFAPRDDLWEAEGLERRHLGPVVGEQPGCVVEVKSIGPLPPWLDDVLRHQAGDPIRFSKFVAASDAVARAAARQAAPA